MRAKDLLLDATRRVIASASGTGKAVAASRPCRSAAGKFGDLVDPKPSERTVLVQLGHLGSEPQHHVDGAGECGMGFDLAGSTARGPLAPYEGLIRAFEPYRPSARLSVKKCPREQLWKCAPSVVLVEEQSAKCISCAK